MKDLMFYCSACNMGVMVVDDKLIKGCKCDAVVTCDLKAKCIAVGSMGNQCQDTKTSEN